MAELSCGIVGLPNVGKSTLFRALTRKQVLAENYPFCTIDPNVGIVNLPDKRLAILSKISKSTKIVPAHVTFVDIAGIVKGASEGEGLGNKFLHNIRETAAIIHVVRCFEDDDVIHVAGSIDPISDIEVINLELALADLQTATNMQAKVAKLAKTDKTAAIELAVLQKIIKQLNDGLSLRLLTDLTDEERALFDKMSFLTKKKVLYVANVDEKALPSMENAFVEKVRAYAEKEGNQVITICAKVESDLAEFSEEESAEYLKELGLEEPGLDRLIRAAFHLLGLITYLTTGEVETRAWTVRKGAKGPEAAGEIHSDLERGFIRAEVISMEDMITYNGRAGAKEAGKVRSEGKEYVVQDGDVILFLSNV